MATWYSVRCWRKGGRGVQSKIRLKLVQGTGKQCFVGCSSERPEPSRAGLFSQRGHIRVPEWSVPICKEAGRHSRTPVGLHRDSLNKTKGKVEGNQRWKWRQVTEEKQRSCTWPVRDGVCKAHLVLKLIQDGWRITRRVSTTTIAVKAKANRNLLLNGEGNWWRTLNKLRCSMLSWFWPLVARSATLVPALSDRI